MGNKLEVGKTYQLVDASKDWMLEQALDLGFMRLPKDGIVTVHSIEEANDGQAMGCSHTPGCYSRLHADVEGDFLAIQQDGLDKGAFVEVEE